MRISHGHCHAYHDMQRMMAIVFFVPRNRARGPAGILVQVQDSRHAWNALVAGVRLPSAVDRLQDERLQRAGVELWLKRDDLIHAAVPGNKWRKLKGNLAQALADRHGLVLTFGGAYSNHLRATAAAGQALGLSTVGIVRGDEHLPLNPSLAYTAEHGMRLRYLDRATYRRKSDPDVIAMLRDEFGPFYLIPEGGSNAVAVLGCAELVAELPPGFDIVCCPCGTGGTLAGLAAGLDSAQRAVGFSVLKGAHYLADEVARLQVSAFGARRGNWRIEHGFHFGGFAKKNADLDVFIADFRARSGITLEWVYVAKMMYGIYALVQQGAFDRGSRILAVITGPPTFGIDLRAAPGQAIALSRAAKHCGAFDDRPQF